MNAALADSVRPLQVERPPQELTDSGERAIVCIDEDATRLAVTTTGRSGLRRAVPSSAAEQIFNRSRVPVMLYRYHAPATEAARPVVRDGGPGA